jgi:hypothetical protein
MAACQKSRASQSLVPAQASMPTHQSAMTVSTATDDQGEHDTGRCSGVVATPEYLGQPAGHVVNRETRSSSASVLVTIMRMALRVCSAKVISPITRPGRVTRAAVVCATTATGRPSTAGSRNQELLPSRR